MKEDHRGMFTFGETEQEVYEPGTILEVELCRSDGEGFGLNIIGGTDSKEFKKHTGVFISSINDEGPAYTCGKLDVGDRLLQINDFSLVGVRHQEAVDAFRHAGTVIKIKLEKFGQQLIVARLSTDVVDGPPAPISTMTTLQKFKNFFNSWAGAMLAGTAAGMLVMFIFTRLKRYK